MWHCAQQTPRFCATELGLTWEPVWSLRGTCEKHSYYPKLGRCSSQELQQRSALRCHRAPPQSLPIPKHYPHEPALVLVHSDTFEHGYFWVRHLEACEIHTSLGLLSSHHKIAAIAHSGGEAPRAHPTPSATSTHRPRLPVVPLKPFPLPPCTVIFDLCQAQAPSAKASLF